MPLKVEHEQFDPGTVMQKCKEPDCGKEFPFTPGEQKFYAERGLFPPKRCPICRMKKRKQHEKPRA